MSKKTFKKGDVVCLHRKHTAQYAIGSGRPADTYETWTLIRVASASRDGKVVNRYQTHPASPEYMSRSSDGQTFPIGGQQQERARRLFAEFGPCVQPYNSKAEVQRAILSTLTERELSDIGLFFGWSGTFGYEANVKTFMNNLDTETKRAEWRRIPKWTRAAICREVMRRERP